MINKTNYFSPFLSTLVVLFIVAINQAVFAQTFNVSSSQEFRQALQDATSNGQNDTIVLANGTYKTTDDSGGTFTFLDNENYDLTIQGSSAEDVILTGDNTDQVLNFNVINYKKTVYINNISIINGYSETNGGGIYSVENLEIKNCILNGNIANSSDGGGFYSDGKSVTITGSTITGNTAGANGGGGFYSDESVTITDSTITGNTGSGFSGGSVTINGSTITGNTGGGFRAFGTVTISDSTITGNTGGGFYSHSKPVTITDSTITGNTGGGGFYSGESVTITRSTITGNTAVGNGGGFASVRAVTITDSTITGNTAGGSGGGFASGGVSTTIAISTITGSTITGNTAGANGGGFASGVSTKIINCIIINNNATNGVYIKSGTNTYILNSIFINNGNNDVAGDSDVMATIYNNYIDESKISVSAFKNNNIFDGELDFADQANDDFHIGENSVLIDAGTTNVEGIVFPLTDIDGNQRISGGSIDIGPYEFSSTRPTINSFTHTGTLKIGEVITFEIDASPSTDRTLSEYEIDFGDGIFEQATISSEHIFDIPGIYDIIARVTDSENEYSTKTISINIEDLSDAEKLNAEFEKGKQFVIDNYSEFGFVTDSEKDKAVTDAEAAKDLTFASMFTQAQLDTAVTDAKAVKDATIADLNTTIASMFTKSQMDTAVADAETAKDLIITQKDTSITDLNTTIASMFSKEQLDTAVTDAKAGLFTQEQLDLAIAMTKALFPKTISLNLGWNLVGMALEESKTVEDIIYANEDKIVSIWKWECNESGGCNWAVYLSGGGTEDYAESKGFKVLSNIEPGEGFWVNCTDDMTLD